MRVPGRPDPQHTAKRLYCVRCEDLDEFQAEDRATDRRRQQEGLSPVAGRLYSIRQIHNHHSPS